MAAAALKKKWDDVPEGMKTPLVVSAIFHGMIVILAITGLPYLKKEIDPLEATAIPIEILPIAEMTTTNKPPVKSQEVPEKPPEEKPVVKEKPPAPPKVEAVEPPKEITPPKPKTEAKPKPKPVVPPPPEEKLEKPEEKPKEEDVAEETPQEFNNLLKNLQDSQPVVDEALPESKTAETPAPAPQATFSETLTMSEIDALRQQLSRCWSIQAGARYAEELVVEVRVLVSKERKVMSATIVDQWRYSQDSYFRAAADSAIRAINSPQCETLNLNPDKYDLWKDMVVTFDPREML
jgi:outer membrane biosynthesis protein TonB